MANLPYDVHNARQSTEGTKQPHSIQIASGAAKYNRKEKALPLPLRERVGVRVSTFARSAHAFFCRCFPPLQFAEHCEGQRVKPPWKAVLVLLSMDANQNDPAAKLQ